MSRLFPRSRRGGKPKDSDDSGVPPLSGWERLGAGAVALGGAAVGGLGFYASFDSVSQAAASWGFTDPWVLPTAIDSAIPVFTGAYLFLIRMDMPLWWARLVPWVLSLVTCALNVAAGNSLWSKVAHGAMSLLWVAVSEIAAHIYAVRIGAATGRRRRMDKVRWSRWFLSPLPTFLLWRRMKLWELTDYDAVLKLEQERIVYQAQLRGRFGRAWRRKAPVASLMPLRLVRTGVPLKETAAAGLAAAGIDPTGIFALPPAQPLEEQKALPAAAAAPQPPATPAPAPAPTPAVPATVNKPRPVTATVPPQPQGQPQGQRIIPSWSTEDELYVIIKDILDNGHREVFEPGGPLTGAEIANVLGQSEGNGRKVRQRLIKTYAAERGVDLPPRATIDQVFAAFAHPMTAVSP
ncbi:membrane protein [Streptomyces phage Gilgamesh]|uniref:Membrane protein n=1 Tax=Streptomyces phage Gilgamesh TaxID=2599890 RepID=A0A5J6TR68_9CAUD|nr:membrane protein [Streptomyces phage Gilgamesh]QFG13271.1 membrane protein [Streptomyces phage Gilgamesh]